MISESTEQYAVRDAAYARIQAAATVFTDDAAAAAYVYAAYLAANRECARATEAANAAAGLAL